MVSGGLCANILLAHITPPKALGTHSLMSPEGAGDGSLPLIAHPALSC